MRGREHRGCSVDGSCPFPSWDGRRDISLPLDQFLQLVDAAVHLAVFVVGQREDLVRLYRVAFPFPHIPCDIAVDVGLVSLYTFLDLLAVGSYLRSFIDIRISLLINMSL